MELTVLGSGSTIAHPHRCSSGLWLETSGGTVMLDLSASMPVRMAREGLPWYNLDAIWISHFHIDHCAGLLPFFAGAKHAQEMKGRNKPLRVHGPRGTAALINKFSEVHNYKLLEQPFPVDILEVEPNESFALFDGVEAVACKTPHTAESLAIRIADEDRSFVYSSDTGFDEILPTFANGADLFVLECSYLRDKTKAKHLELAEAIYIIRKAKCKRAMLTHFYPEWDGTDFAAEVRKLDPFLSSVIEARDGLRVTI